MEGKREEEGVVVVAGVSMDWIRNPDLMPSVGSDFLRLAEAGNQEMPLHIHHSIIVALSSALFSVLCHGHTARSLLVLLSVPCIQAAGAEIDL